MDKWDYKVIGLKGNIKKDEASLKSLGRYGWELVSVTIPSLARSTGTANATAYLKRKFIEG